MILPEDQRSVPVLGELWVHRYLLRGRREFNRKTARRDFPGALIRHEGGYGCIHPWPEFGDPSLGEHLDSLVAGKPTLLARIALRCSAVDGAARSGGHSLFEEVTIPKCHFLWRGNLDTDQQIEEMVAGRFRAVKLKASKDLANFAQILVYLHENLPPNILFRLDFNATIDADTFRAWVEPIPDEVLGRIAFVEDPVPYDRDVWLGLGDDTDLPFAIDQFLSVAVPRGGFQAAVVKPARDGEVDLSAPALAELPLLYTSAMDHPLGQFYAAWKAGVAAAQEPSRVMDAGLLTHHWFEGDAFCEAVQSDGARLLKPGGTGFGFDDLLEGLSWERIR